MQLFIGGAYAGKRDAVRRRFDHCVWHSAYDGHALEGWADRAMPGQTLVLEGWEQWLDASLRKTDKSDSQLRQELVNQLEALLAAEQDIQVVLVMLEMGRGIVPLDAHDRRLRDLAGWLAQDAASRTDKVWYVWNGLVQLLSH